jgi:hypothetical protein
LSLLFVSPMFVGIGVVVGVRCPDYHHRQHHNLPLWAVARRQGGGAVWHGIHAASLLRNGARCGPASRCLQWRRRARGSEMEWGLRNIVTNR